MVVNLSAKYFLRILNYLSHFCSSPQNYGFDTVVVFSLTEESSDSAAGIIRGRDPAGAQTNTLEQLIGRTIQTAKRLLYLIQLAA